MSASSSQAQLRPAPRSTAERASLAVALLLLAAVVGAVLFVWATANEAPASFEIERAAARQSDGSFYLPVTIVNTGDLAARAVVVEATLAGGESATTTFDVIAGHAEASAVLVFGNDPSRATVRVVSYQDK